MLILCSLLFICWFFWNVFFNRLNIFNRVFYFHFCVALETFANRWTVPRTRSSVSQTLGGSPSTPLSTHHTRESSCSTRGYPSMKTSSPTCGRWTARGQWSEISKALLPRGFGIEGRDAIEVEGGWCCVGTVHRLRDRVTRLCVWGGERGGSRR